MNIALGEICELKNGFSFKSNEYLKTDGIPIIRFSNITDGQIDLEDCVRIKENKKFDDFIVNIESLTIPLPPLPEQHRIVARIEELFSSLDKVIESFREIYKSFR